MIRKFTLTSAVAVLFTGASVRADVDVFSNRLPATSCFVAGTACGASAFRRRPRSALIPSFPDIVIVRCPTACRMSTIPPEEGGGKDGGSGSGRGGRWGRGRPGDGGDVPGQGGGGGNGGGKPRSRIGRWLSEGRGGGPGEKKKWGRDKGKGTDEDKLPINFDVDQRDSEFDLGEEEEDEKDVPVEGKEGGAIELAGKSNPYVDVVSRLSPNDMIGKFMSTADPRVQDAVRTTILGLIGQLPSMAFETSVASTGERLASLMFQLQMTGYMFKNAEYRITLSESLGGGNTALDGLPPSLAGARGALSDVAYEALGGGKPVKVNGRIKVSYGGNASEGGDGASAPALEVEVDADSYLKELRGEVERLRSDLLAKKEVREEALRRDLLNYVRSLPAQEMKGLTSTVTPDVLGAMKELVDTVITGIDKLGPETIVEQSSDAISQLCMWQLVMGYNLRELEIRDEYNNALSGPSTDEDDAAK